MTFVVPKSSLVWKRVRHPTETKKGFPACTCRDRSERLLDIQRLLSVQHVPNNNIHSKSRSKGKNSRTVDCGTEQQSLVRFHHMNSSVERNTFSGMHCRRHKRSLTLQQNDTEPINLSMFCIYKTVSGHNQYHHISSYIFKYQSQIYQADKQSNIFHRVSNLFVFPTREDPQKSEKRLTCMDQGHLSRWHPGWSGRHCADSFGNIKTNFLGEQNSVLAPGPDIKNTLNLCTF